MTEQPDPIRPRGARGRHRGTRRIGRVLSVGVLVGLIAAVAVPAAIGWRPYLVKSGSMGSAAPVGSLVAMRPVPARDLHVGDMVMLDRGNDVRVLHRIIQKTTVDG